MMLVSCLNACDNMWNMCLNPLYRTHVKFVSSLDDDMDSQVGDLDLVKEFGKIG